MTQFEALVSELAAATGLPLEIDARDACSLETDGLVVTLQPSCGNAGTFREPRHLEPEVARCPARRRRRATPRPRRPRKIGKSR